MRKRELVHLHALFDRIRRFMRNREDVEEGDLGAYRRLDVAPTEIYRAKGDHEEAVTTLARSLADATHQTGSTSGSESGSESESEGPQASARGT